MFVLIHLNNANLDIAIPTLRSAKLDLAFRRLENAAPVLTETASSARKTKKFAQR